MSVLGRFLERRGADPITDAISQRRTSHVWAGEPVTFDTALRHFAVWSSINLIADLAAYLPVHQYRRTGTGGRVRVDPSPLIVGPAVDVTAEEWRRQMFVSALLRGNAWGIVIERDRMLGPTRIESVHPEAVTPRRRGKLGDLIVAYNGVELASHEFWHMPAFLNPGSPVGLSPISYAAQAIGLGRAAERFGAEWFDDGVHPAGLLTNAADLADPDGSKTQIVKDRFMDSVNGRQPVVLTAGWQYSEMRIPANESQFLDTFSANGGMIASYYGLRPEDIGLAVSGSSVTYANVEQRNIARLVYPLSQWLQRMESRLNRVLPPGEFVKTNVDALLRVDLKNRYDAHQVAIRNGFLSRDEVRTLEDMPPLPGGAGESFDGTDDTRTRITAASDLIRQGFDPAAAVAAVGLDPIAHTGLLPTTLRPEE